jgi:hypothetical protein
MANAAILARWTPVADSEPGGLDYDSSTDTPPASEVAANLSVSTLDRVGLEGFGNPGPVWSGRATPDTSVIDETSYTSFTLTPDVGYFMDLESVTYDYQSYGFAENGYNFYLRTSVDGFAADVDSSSSNAAAERVTFNVSSLTGLTDATEVRIYASSVDSGNRWFDLQGSNTETDLGLIVNGTVAIPEPTTGALAALAGLILLGRRRR